VRKHIRSIAALFLGVAVATCGESATGPTVTIGRAVVSPAFSNAALAVNARLPDFAITYDHARVVVVRSVSDTVKDTTVTLTGATLPATIDLGFSGATIGQPFTGSVDITGPSGVVFRGSAAIEVRADDQSASQPVTINYVGPGATVTRLTISPKTIGLVAPAGQAYTVTGFDALNAPVAIVPIKWTTSDAPLATISASGQLAPTGKRGTVSIAATSVLASATDTATATISLPAAVIALVSGGSQTGKVSQALAASAVVRVTASDGVGVAGATVTFSAPVGGGVTTTSAVTDADGNASTSLTLGTAVGAQSFSAAASGFTVTIPEVATAGDPTTIAAVSGNSATGSVLTALVAPFVVKVTDNAGNPTSGVAVTWTATNGSMASATSTTDASGNASNTMTLGTLAGAATAKASLSAAASVSFTVTAQPGDVAKLAFSAAPAGGTAGAVLTSAVQVQLQDASGNLTTGTDAVTVALAANTTSGVLGGTLTRAAVAGLATFDNLTVTPVGTYSLTASSAKTPNLGSAAFAVTHGGGSQIVFVSQPTGTQVGLTVPGFAVEIRDAFGNLVTDAANVVTLTVATGSGTAVLSGASATAVNGVATFSSFSSNLDDTYTLSAASTGLTPATSSSFTITGVRAITVAQTPANAAIAAVMGTQPTIQLRDANGNAIAKSGVVISVSVGDAPGAAAVGGVLSFTGTSTVTATTNASGLASFTNLGILGVIRSGRLTFSVTSGTTNAIANVTSDITPTAGVAATMTVNSATTVDGPIGGPLAAYPSVSIADVSGNPTTTTVTYTVPVGACTITATVAVVNGAATESASSLGLPASAQSCQVRASSSAGSPINFNVIVRSSTAFTWLGASSTSYATAANWHDAAGNANAPISTSNIFIPKMVLNTPQTAVATSVAQVTLESGARLTASSNTLTVTGTVSAGSTSTVAVSSGAGVTFQGATTTVANLTADGGTVEFDHDATVTGALTTLNAAVVKHPGTVLVLTISGSLTASSGTTLSALRTIKFTGSTFPVYGNASSAGAPLITQISANMSVPNGTVAVGGELQVSGAALTLSNSTSLSVLGDLDVVSIGGNGVAGEVLMTSGTPTLTVGGTATFEGKSQQGQGLTVGTLDLQGNFVQRDRTTGSHGEFEPGTNFLVKFSGGGSGQTVSFDHPGTSAPTQSYFTNVLVTNQGGVTQSTHVYINGATMTIGGFPADQATPAMWATGFGSNNLFITGGATVLVEKSGQLTVTSGGALDLSGGSCRAFNTLTVTGSVIGGTCTTDTSLNQ
jgi:hypothetical protein